MVIGDLKKNNDKRLANRQIVTGVAGETRWYLSAGD
jgi:hypothetical protein